MSINTPVGVDDPDEILPVAVVGAGPVGLLAALGLAHYGIPVAVFEADKSLSLDTKAGTVLTRTVEIMDRYGVANDVLRASLRVDEIGEFDRTNTKRMMNVRTGSLTEDTRFPFVINIPQHHLEPVLEAALLSRQDSTLHMEHRLRDFVSHDDHVELFFDTPTGERTVRARYLLACDGGRSTVREKMGVKVEGHTLEDRYMLVDLAVDLDVDNPRDYPYLAYFADAEEWMVLVRHTHCWRFLFPLPPGAKEPTNEELRDRALRFIGEVNDIEVLGTNVYTVHHRVAQSWNQGNVFLMGDAAHLITPMWALGLNTGALDASNLPWRLAWVLRGWAGPELLAGYEREQAPLAIKGSGQMAESARLYMSGQGETVDGMTEGDWGNAITRSLLGVRLDVEGDGSWGMVRGGDAPAPVRLGDRVPDLPLFSLDGRVYLHELVADSFAALFFVDTRRRPVLPADDSPGLRSYAVSRWDAPHNSGVRERALFDPANRVRERFAVGDDTVVLIRPDGHVAAILPYDADDADAVVAVYQRILQGVSASALSEGARV